MAIDHDQLFKSLLKSFFREFMELFLPEEAALIDFGRIEFLEQEVFTDIPKGKRRRLDLVVKAGLKEGGNKFVLVHNEFQSEREADFSRRMFRSYCHLFNCYDTVIVPVAVFSDDAVWKKPIPNTFSLGLKGPDYVRFWYHLIKLKHLDYRKFLRSNNPVAYALMAKMNYDKKQALRLKQDFFRLAVGAGIDSARKSLLLEFIDTYMRLDKNEERQFNETIFREPEFLEVKKMATTWELAGIKKGMRKGELKGRQADLLLLLERKFGKLHAQVRNKVRRIDSTERLETLLLAVIDARSIDDLSLE